MPNGGTTSPVLKIPIRAVVATLEELKLPSDSVRTGQGSVGLPHTTPWTTMPVIVKLAVKPDTTYGP